MPEGQGALGKILVPFLSHPWEEAFAAGNLGLRRKPGIGWGLRHHEHLFPLRPEDHEALERDPALASRYDPAAPDGIAAFGELVERQHFRLAHHAVADDAINWRRFFAVTQLAALAVEREEVFAAVHAEPLALYEEGLIDGLRVDHVDGLTDPAGYCRRLRAETQARQARRPAPGRAWILVEKILAHDEGLLAGWETDGTTGYDFMSQLADLFHDPVGCERLAAHWAQATGRPAAFEPEEEAARRETLETLFPAQLGAAVTALHHLAVATGEVDAFPPAAIRRCLVTLIAQMRVYRSYGEGLAGGSNPHLMRALQAAAAASRADEEGFRRLETWLGGPRLPGAAGDLQAEAVRRFEQLCAPVAAKAVEDTAFYRHGPLLSRNDVGFSPGQSPAGPALFQAACMRRRDELPRSLLATATHDHKRGEDVRARLAVLSERPEAWLARLDSWRATLAARRGARAAPAPDDEIMLFQTLVGAWPAMLSVTDRNGVRAFGERLRHWQVKALREAGLRTGWKAPDEAYEALCAGELDAILSAADLATLRADITAFVEEIAPAGAANGLAQTLLKLTVPGVPDIYQGAELWDFSLVDPDNRAAVDFEMRASSCPDPDAVPAECGDWRDGRVKQRLIADVLAFRRRQPGLFASGACTPLTVEGPRASNVLALMRHDGTTSMIVVVLRLCGEGITRDLRISPGFLAGTRLVLPQAAEETRWRDLLASDSPRSDSLRLCGRVLAVDQLMGNAVVAAWRSD